MDNGRSTLHITLWIDFSWGGSQSDLYWGLLNFFFYSCSLSPLLNSGPFLPRSIWFFITGQLFLMDRFLDGTFFTFGIEVISFAMRDEEDRVDPVIYIFPRMTKCTFHKFGASGNIESHDALCILPINIVNEKIYIFLWFWFLVLGSLTAMVVFYRLMIILSPRMRAYLLYIRFRLIKKECINIIIKKAQMGDWFLLYMLGQNVDSMIFKEVIHELARKLGYQSKDLIDF